MVNTIDVARVEEFIRDNIEILSQQMVSRTRPHVREKKVVGKVAFFDRIGLTAMEAKTSRHQDSLILDTPHTRRMVALDTFVWGDMIDKSDIVRIAMDPSSDYVKVAVAAANRQIDDIVLNAALGNAYGDESGGTAVALPSAQQIAAASGALTLSKLRQAIEILRAADVDLDNDPMVLFLNAKGIQDLQAIDQYINRDYNNLPGNVAAGVGPLTSGEITGFMGMKIIHCERLSLIGSSTNRPALLMTASACGLAVGEDIRVNVAPRPDKGFNYQLHLEMTMGGTRIHDNRVVDIRFDETVVV